MILLFYSFCLSILTLFVFYFIYKNAFIIKIWHDQRLLSYKIPGPTIKDELLTKTSTKDLLKKYGKIFRLWSIKGLVIYIKDEDFANQIISIDLKNPKHLFTFENGNWFLGLKMLDSNFPIILCNIFKLSVGKSMTKFKGRKLTLSNIEAFVSEAVGESLFGNDRIMLNMTGKLKTQETIELLLDKISRTENVKNRTFVKYLLSLKSEEHTEIAEELISFIESQKFVGQIIYKVLKSLSSNLKDQKSVLKSKVHLETLIKEAISLLLFESKIIKKLDENVKFKDLDIPRGTYVQLLPNIYTKTGRNSNKDGIHPLQILAFNVGSLNVIGQCFSRILMETFILEISKEELDIYDF